MEKIKITVFKFLEFTPVVLIIIIFILPLCKSGLVVGGDWTFPYTNIQLIEYSHQSSSIWSNREIPTGTHISNNNAFMFNLLAGLLSGTGLTGISFQKTILFLSVIGIYWTSYLFLIYLTKHKPSSVVGAMSYLFSPLVFNYLNMGWVNVLFFLALAPLFALVSLEYFKFGGFKKIALLGLLSVLGFSQSQAIVWFPIIFFLIFIYQFKPKNIQKQALRFLSGIISLLIIVFIANAPWIVAGLSIENNPIKATSNFDMNRFSSVFSLLNSVRGWGSLYNLQFETSYPQTLILFSFFPICLIIYSAIKNNEIKNKRLIYLSLSFVLIAPIIYIFRENIAYLPFSSIIRDSSRFTVLTTLGLAIGISTALRKTKNKTNISIILLGLLLYAYPYFSGKLYFINGAINNTYNGKDFRVRLLNIPLSNIEQNIGHDSSLMSLVFPTGGSIKTSSDKRFKEPYWEVYDSLASFSPLTSGIFISDRSGPRVINFTSTLRSSASQSAQIKKLLGIYGINTIYNRSNLKSEINIPVNQEDYQSFCRKNDNQGSEWGITEVCPIKNAYPLVYTPTKILYSSEPISNILSTVDVFKEKIATIGCPNSFGEKNHECGPNTQYKLARDNPQIRVEKESETKYILYTKEIKGRFLLVFNKTYHPGWRIFDDKGKQLEFDHLLINQLVNGWIIDPESLLTSAKYVIEFYPQKVYSLLYPPSIIFFILLLCYAIPGLVRKK